MTVGVALNLTCDKHESVTTDAHFACVAARHNGILFCRFGSLPCKVILFNAFGSPAVRATSDSHEKSAGRTQGSNL